MLDVYKYKLGKIPQHTCKKTGPKSLHQHHVHDSLLVSPGTPTRPLDPTFYPQNSILSYCGMGNLETILNTIFVNNKNMGLLYHLLMPSNRKYHVLMQLLELGLLPPDLWIPN